MGFVRNPQRGRRIGLGRFEIEDAHAAPALTAVKMPGRALDVAPRAEGDEIEGGRRLGGFERRFGVARGFICRRGGLGAQAVNLRLQRFDIG
ncbi:MAG: hypothetical protein HW418_4268, partial [Anaerolineales bacterium]|nr:hypothetical protein [Anaerolineales bacterium]